MNEKIIDQLNIIYEALEKLYDMIPKDETQDSDIIEKLKAGEVLDLSDEEIENVLEYLKENEESYTIKIINNSVSLKI